MGRRHPFPDEFHVTKGETEAQRSVATIEMSQHVGDRIGLNPGRSCFLSRPTSHWQASIQAGRGDSSPDG